MSQILFADGTTLSYEYDAEEQITKVTEKVGEVETVTAYTYDAMGQLLTETVNNQPINTMTYTSDATSGCYGNIQSKNGKVYTYGDENWKDLLTAYDGIEITYDAGGNPLSYRGYTFAWEKGRQLKSAVGNDKTLSYTYNANGIRTSKTVNGEIHNYLLEGTKILRETCLEPDGKTVKYVLNFLYDNEESICGLTYNGTPYYFYKNLQGDVIAITDANGVVKANYSYDAWGVCTITKDESDCNIATVNPFRYRGYYMDVETGMYYVSSRYYNPEVGLWINADDSIFLDVVKAGLTYNLFTYCENNPVNMLDFTGCFGTPIQWVCAVIGGISGWFFGDYIARGLGYAPNGKGFWNAAKYWTIRSSIVIGGAVIGWFSGTTIINLVKAFLVKQPSILLNVICKLGIAGLATKEIYDMIKLALFDAGSIVLSIKKCPIAKEAYYQGLYGKGKRWSSSVLNNKIKNNTYFKEKLKSAMRDVTGTSVSNKKISIEFTNSRDTDLYLAIGKISLYITGTKKNGNWNLTVTGTDIYNFDSFRLNTKFSLGNVANDLGVIMQKIGMMTPYTIAVSFTMVY